MPSLTPDGSTLVEIKPGSDAITTYKVRPGDTLSSIAKMFGVSPNTIRWSNDFPAGSSLKVGQELVILPIDGVRYTAKKGDTLASISKKFHGDQTEIMNFNGLASASDISVGDEIIIPDGVIVAPPAPKKPSYASVNMIAQYTGPDEGSYYIRPVPGPRTQGLHGKNGVDLGGPIGTPIVAAAEGEVIIAREGGWNGGYGSYVVVAHPNGTQTLYAHMSSMSVSAGMHVEQGQKLGEIGRTGKATGPHLHFEVRGAKNPF